MSGSTAFDTRHVPAPQRLASVPRWILTLATALLCAALVWQVAGGEPSQQTRPDNIFAVVGGSGLVFGWLVLRQHPRNLVGHLFLASGAAGAIATCAMTFYESAAAVLWLAQWTPWAALALLPLPLLVFPDGSAPSGRWRRFWILGLANVILPLIPLAAAAAVVVDHELVYPHVGAAVEGPVRALFLTFALFGLPVLFITTIAGISSVFERWRRAESMERDRMRILAGGGVVMLAAIALEVISGRSGAWVVAAVALPAAMTVAILEHELLDLDLYLNRSIVYTLLTAVVLGAYSLFVELLNGSPYLAVALIVAAMGPVKERLQPAVKRLVYGDRALVDRLKGDLRGVIHPQDVLATSLQQLVKALHVPYARIERADGVVVLSAGRHPASSQGRGDGRRPEEFPLLHGGQRIGWLLVAPRTEDKPFSEADRQILEDLSTLFAAAMQTQQLPPKARASA
jgi:two-component system, NarL family, sensor kinase